MILSTRYIYFVQHPARNLLLDKVEEEAKREYGHPIAKFVHAKVLGKRGQYADGLRFVEEAMHQIRPTKRQTNLDRFGLWKEVGTPWGIYIWLKEALGDHSATDAMLRFAAEKYQDADALLGCAQLAMQAEDYEAYEQYVNKAATAGHFDACRRLANFYYLTYLGHFPLRGRKKTSGMPKPERTSEGGNGPDKKTSNSSTGSVEAKEQMTTPTTTETATTTTWSWPFTLTFLSSLFNRSRTRDEYKSMAIDWYDLAFQGGNCSKSALLLALLVREEGAYELGLEYLSEAEKNPKLASVVHKLRSRWDDGRFEPSISRKLLDT